MSWNTATQSFCRVGPGRQVHSTPRRGCQPGIKVHMSRQPQKAHRVSPQFKEYSRTLQVSWLISAEWRALGE
jgi:hypothetical protein